jgi:hypothetical protein
MKKINQFALGFAIALTGALGFSGCSSNDEAEVNNPNFNPETNEVLAKFVFNVSTGNTATTRQSSAATQASVSETFRGIDNAVLFSYKQDNDGKTIAAATTADKRYDLSRIIAAAGISDDQSTRVIETSLPLLSNSLLFYGRAIPGTVSQSEAEAGITAYDQFGHLEKYEVAGTGEGLNIANTNFELSSRISGDGDKFKKTEDLLAAVLTVIMNTNLAGTHHETVTYDGDEVEYGDVYWADYVNADKKSPVMTSNALYALEVKLADAYREMTTIRDTEGELRAGCGVAILATIEDLWSVVNEVRCATPFSAAEAVAKVLAARIHDRIEKYFNATVSSTGENVTDIAFKLTSVIIENLAADTSWPTAAGDKPTSDYFSAISSSNLANFPQITYHLPAGSTHYLFDSTKKQFFYQQNYNSSAVGSGEFTVESYYYPAELLYFGNSPIRVSNKENKTNAYPQTVTNWQDDSKWGADWTKNSHVVSLTQSVAMMNNINYGTALLKTTVSYGSTELKDNNHAIQKYKDPSIGDTDEPDNIITVGNSTFKLVGILVGGQYKKVGWDYIPKSTDNKQGYVYDCTITGSGAINATTGSTPNYTLLFDNYTTATTGQESVYVALELENHSGSDFYGEHGLVRDGGTFYLIGQLDLAGKSAPTWPTHHPLPPYNTDGSSIQTPRVFMQDYMTSVNFVIGENSLKHAYLTTPDLRYSALTLGLSVDMNWSTGIDFGNVILGGE